MHFFHFCFDGNIKQICRTAFLHLFNISKNRIILSEIDAEKLVHAFITFRLDFVVYYYQLVLKAQLIQNAAVRVLTGTRQREHISPS